MRKCLRDIQFGTERKPRARPHHESRAERDERVAGSAPYFEGLLEIVSALNRNWRRRVFADVDRAYEVEHRETAGRGEKALKAPSRERVAPGVVARANGGRDGDERGCRGVVGT